MAVSSEAVQEAAPPPQIQQAAPQAQEPRNNNAEGPSANNALSGSSSDRGLAESSQIPSVPVAVPDVSSSVGRPGWFFFYFIPVVRYLVLDKNLSGQCTFLILVAVSFQQCCGSGTTTAGTVTFALSGTGIGMHYGSRSGFCFAFMRMGSKIFIILFLLFFLLF